MLTLNLESPAEKQQNIALRVRALRISQNLRQEDLAIKSGVSLGSLRRFERTGEISLSALGRLALVLGTLDDLDKLFIGQQASSIAEIELREEKSRRQRVREKS